MGITSDLARRGERIIFDLSTNDDQEAVIQYIREAGEPYVGGHFRREWDASIEEAAKEIVEEFIDSRVDTSNPEALLDELMSHSVADNIADIDVADAIDDWMEDLYDDFRERAEEQVYQTADTMSIYTSDNMRLIFYAEWRDVDAGYERLREYTDELPESLADLVARWAYNINEEALRAALDDAWADRAPEMLEGMIEAARAAVGEGGE